MRRPLNARRLIILSLGLGRDSVAMIVLLLAGKLLINGVLCGPRDVDGVCFSDPGAEWEHSYKLIARLRKMCETAGIPFYVLAKPPETGPLGWRQRLKDVAEGVVGIRSVPKWVQALKGATIEQKAAGGYYHRRAPIMEDYRRTESITIRKSAGCTTNHKIRPINGRFMGDLCKQRFGLDNRGWAKAMKAGEREQHIVLIGYAADEAGRIKAVDGKAQKENPCVVAAYPLVEAGINKADEAAILRTRRLNGTRKSGCVACHFQPNGWFWCLSVIDPAKFAEVVAYEATALATNPKMFLRGDHPISEIVRRWRLRHPTATVDAVLDKSYDRPCGPKRK
jgi:hypothetical protein